MSEAERAEAYLDTVNRMEPDITMLDEGAALASIAISLKRIADCLWMDYEMRLAKENLTALQNRIEKLEAALWEGVK
jgi:hypothetical protein